MAKKYLGLTPTGMAEIEATDSSAGAPNAGDVVALDGTGRINQSMMPVGIGADTSAIQASEGLSAGDYVNIWNSGGSFRVRKADASSIGKQADGFVLAAVVNGAIATVYFEGTNTQVVGQVAGVVYLSDTIAGTGSDTPPTDAGSIVQKIGIATSETTVNFQKGEPITLA